MRIAVVGGGIGGVTAALALARRGVSVTVFEQASTILPVGASLQLGPNATRLLAAVGVEAGDVVFELLWLPADTGERLA